MPQMAPISWLSLFIIFSITFMLYNIMNFYSMNYKSPQFKNKFKMFNKSLNWKW
uniref:ATP synthase complex subunit 8 n=1 Tax=Procecidochares utilis TaxID=716600 RepID=M1R4I8_9MUSC|nr:ATP synthase F0 subunit 8 [Procecidochares utilis]AGG10662.1 ATP synthase F0 subunit 8 [Procecidochares utilis]UXG57158.1 ATP synthase F0 subunit 8 [Procecidochares utilis]